MEPHRRRPKLTKGQRDEVENLYRREAEALYGYASRLLGDRAPDVLDLVQTTFHEAVRAWPEISRLAVGEQRGWLRRVLRNKAVDLYRRQKAIDPTGDLSHLQSRSGDPAEQAGLAIALARCWEEIQRMPPKQQTVVALIWGKSWTTGQVAEHLGISTDTVRGHVWRARTQLRAGVGHLIPFIDDAKGPETTS